MRLGGMIVGGLDGGEIGRELLTLQEGIDAAAGLAGGDAKNDVAASRKSLDRLAGAGKHGLLVFRPGTELDKGRLVMIGDGLGEVTIGARQQAQRRRRQRKANYPEHGRT